jgi:primosomal protein N' (replication factor Y)
MRLAWVAVPVPALDLLTYLVPDSFELPPVGARVLVPLGSRRVTGCVVRTSEAHDGANPAPAFAEASAGKEAGFHDNSTQARSREERTDAQGRTSDDSGGPQGPAGELKSLIDVLDDEPFLPAHIVKLAAWVAEYYACGPGDAIAAAMPPFAWIESERAVRITGKGLAVVRDRETPEGPKVSLAILRALARGRPVPIRVLAGRLPAGTDLIQVPPIHSLVRSLEREGLVEWTMAMRGRGAAFKTIRMATITLAGLEVVAAVHAGTSGPAQPGGEQDPGAGAMRDAGHAAAVGQRQHEALEILRAPAEGLPFAALRDRGIAADTLRRLASRGLIAIRRVRVERDPFDDQAGLKPCATVEEDNSSAGLEAGEVAAARILTAEQSAALDRLRALAARQAFAVALLHGVTGSGKTEVYLQLAKDVLAAGRSVLVLAPEIALTPALVGLFRAAFGDRVAVQHSGLSDGERHDQWHRIRRGEIAIVVGTRSAVFAPLGALGLVVVDEEHDGSYKQEESPRYHGRDVAVVRARREGALVVLGSATPSMETYRHALNGRYERLVLARRVLDRPLAAVRIVNMREEYAAQGPDVVFSEALRAAIDGRLAREEQVLVLLNRRGFATAVLCRQCGNTIDCPNCSVSLTVHGRQARRARCHYCNYSTQVPTTCPACAAPYLEDVGIGTERLEHETARLFPGARIARLDRDVASRRGATASLLARFGAREIDILIGTQMIAKGHDFPRVTLVGVISADVGLGLPDFRASERTFQLLTQVVGRAGRGERPGDAIIQTLYPDHYSVRLACQQDYPGFFAREIEFRRAMRYPPYVSLVNAIVRGPSLQAAMDDAADLVRRVRAAAEGQFRVLGPAPAAFVKLRGEHRAQFFVKGTRRAAMRQAVQRAVAARADLRRRITIDVDPLTVL